MRVVFVCCFVMCAAAVMTGAASDGMSALPVAARLTDSLLPRPVIVVIGPQSTPTPAPTETPAASTTAPEEHAPPVATRAPTPRPTIEPTPKPTLKPTPKPTPRPTTAPKPPSESSDQVRSEIRSAWGGDDNKAIDVANCESGLNPQASSPSGTNLGLWQFTMATYHQYGGSGDPRNASAYTQTQVAWNLYQQQGWSPWGGCASS